ncbi:4-hydroxy-tetrahydrodipicolinate synthase [Halosquirtibacter xylanolyticus]|uniref:4-hydroxy-tetrahydrodipicolinate synthase n=1 Tax=Halosquirtibacter xylanolyticus TaxID=3374599 RepID=UPI003747F8E3|nr:4-hydroxy-tetrahydrodipicolinate synthase [Prolixibacteraceae bacterium]
MNHLLKGAGVALVTPFDEDDQICYSSLAKLITYQIENGADYLVVLGTTAEAATLTQEEQDSVLQFVIKENDGKLPIVVGIGGNNTKVVCDKINNFSFEGVDAILSVTPYYNKPNQAGLISHYKAIEEASPLPIVIYNVPGRTGVDMTPATILELARYSKKFIAVKDGSGNICKCMHITKEAPKHFIYLSGDDKNTLPLISVGAQGVISVSMNATPRLMSKIVHLSMANQYPKALQLQHRLLHFMEYIFEEGNPTGVKAALASLGIVENHLRLPLIPASEYLFDKIETELNHNDII